MCFKTALQQGFFKKKADIKATSHTACSKCLFLTGQINFDGLIKTTKSMERDISTYNQYF